MFWQVAFRDVDVLDSESGGGGAKSFCGVAEQGPAGSAPKTVHLEDGACSLLLLLLSARLRSACLGFCELVGVSGRLSARCCSAALTHLF